MFLCIFFEIVKLKVHDFKDFLFLFFRTSFYFTFIYPINVFSWKLLVNKDPVEESWVFARHVDIVFYENDTPSVEGDSVFLYENDSSEQCPTCDYNNDGSVLWTFLWIKTPWWCCHVVQKPSEVCWQDESWKDLLSSDISRLFTLCHILYNIGIVCITDRWNNLKI